MKEETLEKYVSNCCEAKISQKQIVWLGLTKDYPFPPKCSKCGKICKVIFSPTIQRNKLVTEIKELNLELKIANEKLDKLKE